MRKTVFDTERFSVLSYKDESEGESHRILKADSVRIVILNTRDEILMLDLRRVAFEEVCVELPGGRIDPDETPEEAALRELAEETGLSGVPLDLVLTVPVLPALLSEQVHVFMGVSDAMPWRPTLSGLSEGVVGGRMLSPQHIDQLILGGRLSAVDALATHMVIRHAQAASLPYRQAGGSTA